MPFRSLITNTNGWTVNLRRFRALARDWEALADTDPFFGVLSDPTKYGGRWETEEFFESGRAHVQKLMRTLGDLRVSFDRGTCLDFGCGVGRLTRPLSEHFAQTVGVDVAPSMIDRARRYCGPGGTCDFVVNRDPDLRQFQPATFDVVHSCLVLQHVPPEIALRYIGEFFRVCKPGGLVVFQLPAETRTEAAISMAHALPDSACAAGIAITNPPITLGSSEYATLRIVLTNHSPVLWRHDIPAGRHICLANHWRHEDGTMAIHDDGRAVLPRPVAPGESVEVDLKVQAPVAAGNYELEVDLVQEHVCWFAAKGSKTARVAIAVDGPGRSAPAADRHPEAALEPLRVARGDGAAWRPVVRRILRRFRGGTPTFEMHTVPRPQVETAISNGGGTLLHAVDDNAAGARWLSYTYVCRRLPPSPARGSFGAAG